jgi:hypothetical protein
MKVYKFEVVVKSEVSSSNLIDSIIQEVQSEKRQVALTHEINKKTTELHKEILGDFINAVNKEISKVGLDFDNDFIDGRSNNQYNGFESYLCQDNNCFIRINGISDRDFKDSKYTTYTGEFQIFISKGNGSPTRIESVDEAIVYMKDIIKRIIYSGQ